ncbi:phosphoribosylanthranilate isomerase [Streptomyces goshikiensis]
MAEVTDGAGVFIKICGLKTGPDVDAAVAAGADAVGFVFAAGSPRTVDAAVARELAARVPAGVLTVGVFRGQPVAEVRRLTEESGVRGVQLHGDEGPEYYEALRAGGRTLLRATARHVERCGEYGEDLLLIDAPDPGSGKPWNWAAAEFTAPGGRWLLAGGLGPDNVRRAVETTGAWGVDVSSGVERARGVKSPELIRAFIEAARAARV